MGLVFIVLLVAIALLFALQFLVLKGDSRVKETFTREQVGENSLNSFLLTTTTCDGLSVTDLLQNCASYKDISCDGKNSCDFVASLADELFNQTLVKWGRKYNLTAVAGNQRLLDVIHVGCPGERDASLYPIPSLVGGDQIFITLHVC